MQFRILPPEPRYILCMPTYIAFICDFCSISFNKELRQTFKNRKHHFCNQECSYKYHNKQKLVSCLQCSKEFLKINSECISSPNHFCSKSCAAKYNNTHKTKGNRRSKLEIWLEGKLKEKYKGLEILFNCKEAIDSELDIYIPKLNLAIEINGIFHYKPIYGQEKLSSIKNNDKIKLQVCFEKKIDLVIIDSSLMKSFKPEHGMKYLNAIIDIINVKYIQG